MKQELMSELSEPSGLMRSSTLIMSAQEKGFESPRGILETDQDLEQDITGHQ